MLSACRCSVVIALYLCAGLVDASPQKTSDSESEFRLTDNVDFVLLDVSVTNSKGAAVGALDRSAFRVFEDGQHREISYFAAGDAPVAFGLVMDNSGSMAGKRPDLAAAGVAFAKESNPSDQFFVVNFNDSVSSGLPPATPFTDNLQMLQKALPSGRASGRTALYDAVAYSLRHLALSAQRRRTLIVVTDGRDNASNIQFSQLTRMVEASRATIYTVGLCDVSDSDLNTRMLRKLARLSGGDFFEPKQVSQIRPIFDAISENVRHRYTIGYTPDEVSNKRERRTVRVIAQMNGRKFRVHTRTAYSVAPTSFVASSAVQVQ